MKNKMSQWLLIALVCCAGFPGLVWSDVTNEMDGAEGASGEEQTPEEQESSIMPIIAGGASLVAGAAYIVNKESDADDNGKDLPPAPPPPVMNGDNQDDGDQNPFERRSIKAVVIGAQINCGSCNYDEYAAQEVPIDIEVELTITEDGDEVVDSAYYILPVVPGNANNDPTCPKYGGNRIDITDQVRADPSILDGGAQLNVNWSDYCP